MLLVTTYLYIHDCVLASWLFIGLYSEQYSC